MKAIFITGGVYSGLGKGIAAASVGKIIQSMGYSVTMVKMDPYLQIDAGTMSPFEHGETFVTQDGGETDLDLGNYERFLNISLTKENNITSGKIYQSVINKERHGDYLGQTVQVVPHIVDEIKNRIKKCATGYDVVVVEVGGTVGDIESPAFYEAARQMKRELGPHNTCYIHLAPIIRIPHSGEQKTKPLQHSVKALRETGILPDILLCRTDTEDFSKSMKAKISAATDIDEEAIIPAPNVKSIYAVPLKYVGFGMHKILAETLQLSLDNFSMETWESIVNNILHPEYEITVTMAGKYTQIPESYHSVTEALIHAGAVHKTRVKIHRLDTEALEKGNWKAFGLSEDDISDIEKDIIDNKNNGQADRSESTVSNQYSPSQMDELAQRALAKLRAEGKIDAVIIPGGFGERGVEGMIQVARFARENNVPLLGLCLGLQVSIIEFMRDVCGKQNAHSTEFIETCPVPVIDLMESQKTITEKGGTMRLGGYTAKLSPGSKITELYKDRLDENNCVVERHRHRYEVNVNYHDELKNAGMLLVGLSPDGHLVEHIELENHPYFVATQAHPEFLSRLESPHPLFVGLVGAVK